MSQDVGQNLGDDHLTGLPVPDVVNWPIFPFKGDLEVRTVKPFAEEERIRAGDPGGPPCGCSGEEGAYESLPEVWANRRWRVTPILFGEQRAPFPAYMLNTVKHMDFEDLDHELAADFGVMCMRMDRAIRAIGSIGRVHMNRWGDGGSHFHVWFLGRPKGAWQLSGYTLPLWGFTLPPLPDETHRANDAVVAEALAASEPA